MALIDQSLLEIEAWEACAGLIVREREEMEDERRAEFSPVHDPMFRPVPLPFNDFVLGQRHCPGMSALSIYRIKHPRLN